MNCPVCRGDLVLESSFPSFPLYLPSRSKPFSEGDYHDLEILRCLTCNLRINSIRDERFYTKIYSNQRSYVSKKSNQHWNKFLDINSYDEIIDIGGGHNSITEIASKDTSKTIVDYVISDQYKANADIKCLEMPASKYLELSSSYSFHNSAIFVSHLLEHLVNFDLFLSQCASLCGGPDILIEMPNIKFFSENIPHYTFFHEHCSLLRPVDVKIILKQYGYGLKSILNSPLGHDLLLFRKDFQPSATIHPEVNYNEDLSTIASNKIYEIIAQIEEAKIKSNSNILLQRAAGGNISLLLYHVSQRAPDLLNEITLFDGINFSQFSSCNNMPIHNSSQLETCSSRSFIVDKLSLIEA